MVDPSVEFADALGDRYTIERELGRGGMATVYLARDVKHGRLVALKVLHPELAASLSCERFRREVLIAARLQHPHILTVLDSGDSAGRLWFTMSFVEGESLRDRLVREHQLPLDDALTIAHQVASALDYAHRHGIIHRDIKPENILLIGDDALVADFGIARALAEGSGLATTTTITAPGAAVGTAAYMSPEQASAESYLDGRTDVYALACVLYEMLAGEPPFTGPTVQAVIAKRFSSSVPSVRGLRPSVSERVDLAIQRAMAPVRADRFRTPCDFSDALKGVSVTSSETPSAGMPAAKNATTTGVVAARGSTAAVRSATAITPTRNSRGPVRWTRQSTMAAGIGAIAVAGLLATWQYVAPVLRQASAEVVPAAADAAPPKRVAVLPFENMGDSSDAYFADGVGDAVRGKLTSVPGLQVTARTSSVQYRNTSKTPQQIGQELGVDYLVTGTVRWERGSGSESRVQVSPELVQVSSAAAKWQQPFDASLTDVFRVQGDIAAQIAQSLGVELNGKQRATLVEQPTVSVPAYDAYLKGQDVSDAMGATDPATLRRAIAYYEAAVALDPNFALAWSQLSRARSIIYLNATPTPARARDARVAAERALALSPDGAAGHLALGNYYLAVADNMSALREFDLGRRAAPTNAELLTQTARAEQSLGRYEAALSHLQEASALDPRSVATARGLARTLLWLRRYPAALDVCDRGLALAPGNLALLENQAMIYLAKGDLRRARAVLDAAPESVDRTALAVYLAHYWDLAWVLDNTQQQLVTTVPAAAFDGDVGQWALSLAEIYRLHGDSAKAKAYADSATIAYEQQLRTVPADGQHVALYALALAMAGHSAEGIRQGQRAMAILPPSRDAYVGAYTQHQVARMYIAAGEPEQALNLLEQLLRMPYYLSPAWLRIDPNFAALRGDARFRRLVAQR